MLQLLGWGGPRHLAGMPGQIRRSASDSSSANGNASQMQRATNDGLGDT